jgi:hypothetical protein
MKLDITILQLVAGIPQHFFYLSNLNAEKKNLTSSQLEWSICKTTMGGKAVRQTSSECPKKGKSGSSYLHCNAHSFCVIQ